MRRILPVPTCAIKKTGREFIGDQTDNMYRYGFICGAYMPVSQFSDGLQKVISFLPGTYATSLLRNHAMRGVFSEMGNRGFPPKVVEAIKDGVDCNLYFFGSKVPLSNMYIIPTGSVIVAVAIAESGFCLRE